MKKNILTLAALLGFTAIYAQKVPITFEPNENGADWTWTVFENNDNPPLEIVENPSKTGIKNAVKHDGKAYKFEPIFVFYKP